MIAYLSSTEMLVKVTTEEGNYKKIVGDLTFFIVEVVA